MDYLDIKKKTEEFNEEYNNNLQNLEDEIQKRDSIARKNLENNLSESEKRLEDLHYQQKVLDEIIEEKAVKNQYLTKNVLTQTRKLSKIKEPSNYQLIKSEDNGTRTHDLLRVMQMLSQLSYASIDYFNILY